MEWIYTENQKPVTYKTGNWDGKNSDQVLVEDKNGKHYIAHLCEGFMDGAGFEDWYEWAERDPDTIFEWLDRCKSDVLVCFADSRISEFMEFVNSRKEYYESFNQYLNDKWADQPEWEDLDGND